MATVSWCWAAHDEECGLLMAKTLYASRSGERRFLRAAQFLSAIEGERSTVVVGQSLEPANRVARAAVTMRASRAAFLGLSRTTLPLFAAKLAAPLLARRGVSGASRLAREGVISAVVRSQSDALGRLEAVAGHPGLPRALAHTFDALRGARVTALDGVDPDLARLYVAYERELVAQRLLDESALYAVATEALVETRPFALVLYDLAPGSRTAADFVAALFRHATTTLATMDANGDVSPGAKLGLGVPEIDPQDERDGEGNALARLRRYVFTGESKTAAIDPSVELFASPGEARECVEIARRVLAEAERGVPFERMAVLLRAPRFHRLALAEAFRRANVPAFFASGSKRPDPAGRALLALLRCAAEGLSARAFAEYLSLSVVPERDEAGAPASAPAQSDLVAERDETPNEERPAPPNVPSPRRFEALLADGKVLGGRERWSRRLSALEAELRAQLSEEDDEARKRGLERKVSEVAQLRAFAIPLIDRLAALPARATPLTWAQELTSLTALALGDADRVVAVLADLLPLRRDEEMDLDEVRRILAPSLSELVVREVKRSEGRVYIASIDDARGLVFDVVFVPGLAERMFPAKLAPDPMLLDDLRARLSPDLETDEGRAAAEREKLRLAIGAAREKIVFSVPRFDAERARPRVPSFYALEILRATEGVMPGFDALLSRAHGGAAPRLAWPAPEDPADAIDAAEHDLAVLARVKRAPKEMREGAMRYLSTRNPHVFRSLRFRYGRWNTRQFGPHDGLVQPGPLARAALDEHAPDKRAYSASALEQLAVCPYRFYLRAILRLAPREPLEAVEVVDARQRGTLMHEAQRIILTRLRDEGLLPIADLDAALVRLDGVIAEVAERAREELAPVAATLFDDGIALLRMDLREWLRRTAHEGTTPRAFELGFGLPRSLEHDEKSAIDAVRLDAGITLRGSIDLVEEHDGMLRATDYKSGIARAPKDVVVDGGRVLQPVLYALALEKLYPDRKVEGGRLLYCTLRGNFEARDVPLDDLSRERVAILGAVLAQAIEAGSLPAAPFEPRRAREKSPCETCDYLAVCGPYEPERTRKKDAKGLARLNELRRAP